MHFEYRKGYTPEQRREVDKTRKRTERAEERIERLHNQEVIVWDGEGMKLSGDDKAQHYVLFGCSARPDSPLVIRSPKARLTFEEIADYCMDIVRDHPNAVHLGYYFKYDQNMIIWSLPWPAKQVLYSSGSCMISRGDTKYYVRCVFGKTLRMTRIRPNGDKSSILIEDFAPFFASSFVKAYETLFREPTDPRNWEIVKQGKADRAEMLYRDMAKVTRYWRAEIMALGELATEFRRIMFEADFMLSQWHGPGALANYIRRTQGLTEHEWGGKEDNLPPAVHEAVKGAYYGGHFEQYKIGYVRGPIHSYDINSAYPSAFCEIPSLRKGGYWRKVGPVSGDTWRKRKDLRTSFGVFKVRWKDCRATRRLPLDIQPLPHRSSKGNISYPTETEGWYWAPEVLVAEILSRRTEGKGFEILDGWVWEPADDNEWPWEDLFSEMYKRRRTLKRNKNPVQMAFKLALNSMYGKMAQRAGGKEEAPQSHTLCIAGYITSACRAKVMWLMQTCPTDDVISVETDGIYTLTAPDNVASKLPMSDELGEWEHTVYDEMVLLQSGVYLLKKGGVWQPPKTRGIAASYFLKDSGDTDISPILSHLAKCTAEVRWPGMHFDGGESFIGLGTAIARCTKKTITGKYSTNPFKASDLHCTWFKEKKTVDIECWAGKRRHVAIMCRACERGETPDITWHDMVIHSDAMGSTGEAVSTPYALPWEKGYEAPQWELDKEAAGIGIMTDPI